MGQSLCQRFGFDRIRIQNLLRLAGLSGSENLYFAGQLHDLVIRPNIDRIVDDFYSLLEQHQAFRKIVPDPLQVDRLKATQRQYLLTLGQQYSDPDYFEKRLIIGAVHRRVGVSLSLYQCFYSHLQALLIASIPAGQYVDEKSQRDLINFIIRITSLDMMLAIEVYHSEKVVDLEHSIRSMKSEGDRLRRSLQTDSLTGVFSRQHALGILKERLSDARHGNALSVVMADLDDFKQINDRYGHLVGDRLLQAVAARMVKTSREKDIVGRYGGEEFIMIFADTEINQAVHLATRICRQVAADPVHVENHIIPVTVSLGVAEARPNDDSTSLSVRADDALYLAKDSGKNTVRSELELPETTGLHTA